METTIKLPDVDLTQLSMEWPNGEKLSVDILELDELQIQAQQMTKNEPEKSTSQFCALFEESYGLKITPTQGWVLLKHKQKRFEEIKKNGLT